MAFSFAEAAAGHQHQCRGDVGDVLGEHVRRVRHTNAALPAEADGHAVITDTKNADDLKVGQTVEK